jgi:hypothetical protein
MGVALVHYLLVPDVLIFPEIVINRDHYYYYDSPESRGLRDTSVLLKGSAS